MEVIGLSGATIERTPQVCHDCVWWQSRGNKTASKQSWVARVEEEFGEWGSVYLDDDGRWLGSMQYGPSVWFPRAADLPAGPASEDAVLVTCVYVADAAGHWVEKSLLLAAIGEARDRGAAALEAFAYRHPGEPGATRRHVHRTVFPRDFLDDFGFATLRRRGRIELCRLELGGLLPVAEGTRARVLRVVQEAFAPAPTPAGPGP
jgi:GNAT superfamily N-acetyltransferase